MGKRECIRNSEYLQFRRLLRHILERSYITIYHDMRLKMMSDIY